MTPFPSLNKRGQGSTLDTLIRIQIACILLIQLLTLYGREPASLSLRLRYHFSSHHEVESQNITTGISL